MTNPRWRKLSRDVLAERGRLALMSLAIAVSLAAVVTVLGAQTILRREIAVNYLGTRPASATLELPGGVTPALLAAVRQRPDIAEADARDVVPARVRVGNDWRPLLLFVVDDFAGMRLNTFRAESGAWPPPDGTMLVERAAVSMLEAGEGATVVVKPPGGPARPVLVSGLVHDPGLAPAWQERSVYGYASRATLAALGEPPLLHELRIEVRGRPGDKAAIEAAALELATWLGSQGHPVHQIRVPPPLMHPHQRQMETILLMMLAFAGMALVLSAILVAASLAAMLARQVREIGAMKTLGASSSQLAGMYGSLVVLLGTLATLLALPAGIAGARFLAGAIAAMLNFTLTSLSIPGWVFVSAASAGILVPLVVALVPVSRASRTTVREAIDQHGVSGDTLRARFARLPRAARNALRRPRRLALTLSLLAAGGAMFMTAIDVSRGWSRNVAKITETRFYDVEVRLHAPAPEGLAVRLRSLPGVRTVEAWGYSPAAIARPGEVDVVRTYPDRGHGSLSVLGPPAGTELIRLPLLAGRWLVPEDTGAVVVNHALLAQAPGLAVGSRLDLSIDGEPGSWRIVGVVEEIGSMGVAYVTDRAFARVAGAGGADGSFRMLRIASNASSPGERAQVIRAVEAALADAGVAVESVAALAEVRTAVGDHVLILVKALVAMAIVLATVGTLGLASAMSIGVVERTRELAVMRTLGATPDRIARMLVAEALVVGAASWLLAVGLSIPLALGVDRVVGRLGFLAPLPLVVAPGPIALWLGIVGVVAVAATWLPARRAARLTVAEALARV